jgi:antitoxin component YwqK of YwqJK toxin-antitoxin module
MEPVDEPLDLVHQASLALDLVEPECPAFGQLQHHHQMLAKLITLSASDLPTLCTLRLVSRCFTITREELERIIEERFLIEVVREKRRGGPPVMHPQEWEWHTKRILRYHTLPNGLRHGPFTSSKPAKGDLPERLMTSCHFRFGVVSGVSQRWYKNGQLRRHYTATYQGAPDGVELLYHSNGQLHQLIEWSNNRPEKGQTWYDTGQLKEQVYYTNGFANGQSIVWWPNGTVRHTSEYSCGVLHGLNRWWDQNGRLRTETRYLSGMKHGLHRSWWHDHPKGSDQLEEQVTYNKDREQGELIRWYRTGQTQSIINYHKGKKQGVMQEWYIDGTSKSWSEWAGDYENGKTIFWDKDGTRTEYLFVNGMLDGECCTYRSNGSVTKTLYRFGTKVTTRRRAPHPSIQPQCEAHTKAQKQCRYRAKEGGRYCGVHLKRKG